MCQLGKLILYFPEFPSLYDSSQSQPQEKFTAELEGGNETEAMFAVRRSVQVRPCYSLCTFSWLVHLVSGATARLVVADIAGSLPSASLNPRPGVSVASWEEHQLLQVAQSSKVGGLEMGKGQCPFQLVPHRFQLLLLSPSSCLPDYRLCTRCRRNSPTETVLPVPIILKVKSL